MTGDNWDDAPPPDLIVEFCAAHYDEAELRFIIRRLSDLANWMNWTAAGREPANDEPRSIRGGA